MVRAKIRTRAEIAQSRLAARKHGVYAMRDRGAEAMTAAQRSQYAELQEQLETRQGVIKVLREAAAQTVILAQVAQSYCVKRHKSGMPLGEIALLRALPAFWNSAGRALKVYLDILPDDREVLELSEHIKAAIGDGEDEHS
jgi:hypothetical protein